MFSQQRQWSGDDWCWFCLAMGAMVMLYGLLLPRATIAQAALPPTFGQPLVYIVQAGDNIPDLTKRAVRGGVLRCGRDLREAIDTVYRFNPGLTHRIQPGDRIVIPVTNPRHPRPGVMAALMGCPGAEMRLATPLRKK